MPSTTRSGNVRRVYVVIGVPMLSICGWTQRGTGQELSDRVVDYAVDVPRLYSS